MSIIKRCRKAWAIFTLCATCSKKATQAAKCAIFSCRRITNTQLNFTFKGLDAARSSLARLDSFIERLQKIDSDKKSDAPSLNAFKEALADDLNISEALAALFDLVRDTNARIDQNLVGKAEAGNLLGELKKIDSVLGLLSFEQESFAIPEEVLEALTETRRGARG